MAKKTNCIINGIAYYKIYRKVGKKLNNNGVWVDNYKNFYGSCKAEAEAAYKKYMQENNRINTDNKCLGEVIDTWANTVFMKSSELSENTKQLYYGAYKNIFRSSSLAGRIPSEVSAMDLQNLYNNSVTGSGATIKALHSFLSRFYKYAELTGICSNIASVVTIPRTHKENISSIKRVEVWNDSELKKVLEALEGSTLKFLVVLAVNTGARISELLALNYDDIDGNSLIINKQLSEAVTSNNNKSIPHLDRTKTPTSNRIIPLSEYVLKELKKHKKLQAQEMKKHGYKTNNIFTTNTGKYYYRRNITRSLERLYKRIGIEGHNFHCFRHTFGSNLSRAGVPIEQTYKLMGHSSIQVTAQYYINIDFDRQLEAVEKLTAFS